MAPLLDQRPPIAQVFETVLYAENVLAAVPFYTDILGLKPLRPPTAQSTVFRIAPDSMLLLVDPNYSRQTGRQAPHHGTAGAGHAALRIDDAHYDAWRTWLTNHGVQIEKEVTWPPGGRSIYFRDPAGNSVELAAGNVWGG
ncbi:MAG: VOC family protein [Phycisphaerales bacterium]